MSADAIWSAFAETGEPALYLLYRAAEAEKRKEQTASRGLCAAG